MDGTLAEIRLFGGNFAPRNWAYCGGQLLSISQNQALFSLLGTTYGGDGRTTFALPDLRGRVAIGEGTGPGLSSRPLGQRSGQETVTLNTLQMPSHFHSATTTVTPVTNPTVNIKVADQNGAVAAANGNVLGKKAKEDTTSQTVEVYVDGASATFNDGNELGGVEVAPGAAAGSTTVNPTGGNQPHNNMQPYLTLHYIICTNGLFPSRS